MRPEKMMQRSNVSQWTVCSGFAPEDFTTLAHFSVLSAINCPKLAEIANDL
jgi:predicted Ser/Thr protein kinase